MYPIPFDPETDRKLDYEQSKALVRRAFGSELLTGMRAIVDDTRATHQVGVIRSFRDFFEAFKVDRTGENAVVWQTDPVPEDLPDRASVAFVFPVSLGSSQAWPQPSGQFDLWIDDAYALSFREVKYSTVWRRSDLVLAYDAHRVEVAPPGTTLALDAWNTDVRVSSHGLMCLKVPAARVRRGEPLRLKVTANCRQPSASWFRLDAGAPVSPLATSSFPVAEGILFWLTSWWRCVEMAHTPPVERRLGEYGLYFGEIHAHTGVNSDGEGTLDEAYRFARDVANVDFYAQTDHDDAMTRPEHWEMRKEAANRYNAPGVFPTLLAYEYTSFLYGHRNVYFRDDDAPLFSTIQPVSEVYRHDLYRHERHPRELYAFLDAIDQRAVVVPHHPCVGDHPFNWNTSDPRYDRLVEIFSGWGNHETGTGPLRGHGSDKHAQLTVAAALARGLRLGFVASSDSHDGYPGAAQGKLQPWWSNKYSPVGSGRAVVLARERTRAAIWDALHARRCYATTGDEIELDFRVDGRLMGTEFTAPAGAGRKISVRVKGPGRVRVIHVIRNGRVLERAWCDEPEEAMEFEDRTPSGEDCYYARVTMEDGEMAWSSPVWVTAS